MNVEQYLDKAQSLRAAGKLVEASRELAVARSLAPEDLDCAICASDVLDSQGLKEQALRELLTLWPKSQREDRVLYRIANLYSSLKHYDQACWFYERTLDVNAIHTEALHEYAELLLAASRDREALIILERLRLLEKDNTDVLVRVARAWMGMGDSSKAIEHLKAAYRLEPGRLDLRLELVDIYVREELFEQAVKLLLPMDEQQGPVARKYSLYIRSLIGLKQYAEAEQALNAYATDFPRDAEVFRLRAHYFERLQQPQEVESALLQVLHLDREWSNVMRLATFYQGREEFEKLEQFLVEMLDLFPQEARLSYQLAQLYKSDSTAEAMDFIDRALQLDDSVSDFWVLKGELFIKLNKYARAMEWFEQMRARFPDQSFSIEVERLIEQDRRYKETVGLLEQASEALEANAYRKALQLYREVVERIPDNPDWLEQLGNLYSFEVSYSEAMECYARAREFAKPEDQFRLYEKSYFLAYLHHDFERALDMIQRMYKAKPQELSYAISQIQVERHLLAERTFPVKYFQDRMKAYQEAANGAKAQSTLIHGYSHLFLGSHLLDATVWASAARECLDATLTMPGMEKWLHFAYRGLYQVSIMDRAHDRILPLLSQWASSCDDSMARRLLVAEYLNLRQMREAVRTLQTMVDQSPEDPALRYQLVEVSCAEFEGPTRSRQLKTLIARLQERCQRVGDWTSYFDYAMALLHSSLDRPSEDFYQRILQGLKKAIRLADDRSDLQQYMLKVMDYSGLLNEKESRLVYSKKRIFLEKELARWPDSARLLMELGRLMLSEKGDETLGIKVLTKSLTLDPALQDIHFMLGEFYAKNQDSRRAYHHYLKLTEFPLSRDQWDRVVNNMQRIL